MVNLGRLPDELLRRFACEELAVPSDAYEGELQQFERLYDCNLVTYRTGCTAVGGPDRLCSHAYAASLSVQAGLELRALEETLQGVVLVAYEHPWRFRSDALPDLQPQG